MIFEKQNQKNFPEKKFFFRKKSWKNKHFGEFFFKKDLFLEKKIEKILEIFEKTFVNFK